MARLRPGPRRLAALLAVGWWAGCGTSTDDLHVDPGALDLEVAFVVEVDGDELRRIGAPFGQGDHTFGKPTFDGARPERSLFLVSLDGESLAALVPGYAPERISEFAVTELDEATLDPLGEPATIAVPAEARVHAVDLDLGTLREVSRGAVPALAEIALVVPTDSRFCERHLEAPVAFGARPHLLGPPTFEASDVNGEPFHKIRDIVPLARDHVLAISRRLLFELRAGEEIADPAGTSSVTPGRTHRSWNLGLADASYRAFALSEDRRTVWAVGGDGDDRGFVARYGLGPDGLSQEQLFTTDANGAPLPRLRDVIIDDEGRVLTGGDRRGILVWTPQSPTFAPVALPEIDRVDEDDDHVHFLMATGDPTEPHLVGLKADAVLTGDAGTPRFDLQYVRRLDDRPLGVSPYLEEGVAMSPEERWVVGRGAIFSRWERSVGWNQEPLAPTPNILGCTLGAALDNTGVHFVSVAPDADHVFVIADRCNAILARDRVRGCTAVLSPPNEPPMRGEDEVLKVLRLGEGRLWIGGERGRLFTVDRP